MLNPKLNLIFLVTAAIYLATLPFTPYPLQFAVKSLPIFVLITIAWTQLSGSLRLSVVAALIASAAGDIFLALTFERSFIFGLGAFLVAQLIYAVTFVVNRSKLESPANRVILSTAILGFATLMAFYILPSTNELFIPVTAYLGVITFMGISAALSNMHKITVIGALSFIASDAILAQSIFKEPLPFSSFLVMTTYYFAQYLILKGIVLKQQTST